MNTRIFTIVWLTVFMLGLGTLSAQLERKQFVDGKIWVKIKPSAHLILPEVKSVKDVIHLGTFPGLQALAEKHGVYKLHKAFVYKHSLLNDIYTVWYSNIEEGALFARELADLDYVEYAEQAPMAYSDFTPNDYNPFQQWHIGKIEAPAAWDVSKGDASITVAIVDDAVLLTHEDIQPNIYTNPNEIAANGIDDDGNGFVDDVNGWDAANNDNNPNPDFATLDCDSQTFPFCHGTSVASSAAGATNNGKGVAAIGFNCKIIPIKCQQDGASQGGIQAGYEGVSYAMAAGADVINMSWGGTGASQTAQSILTAAHMAGIVLVASAGNDNNAIRRYPCSYRYVIGVAATDAQDEKSWFSCFHDSVDVSAPGSAIRVAEARTNTSYGPIDGTSFSSPITAGLCALMLSANKCLTPEEIEAALKATADSIPDMANPTYLNKLGAGRINAKNAMLAIKPTQAPPAIFTQSIQNCGGTVTYAYSAGASSGCPSSFFWSFTGGNPSTSTDPNPVVTYTASGTYDVTLVATNGFGSGVNTVPVTITVNAIPDVNAGADVSGCVTTTTQLNATSNTPGVTYQWTPSTGLSATNIPNPILTFGNDRNYFCTVTSPNGCTYTDTVFADALTNPSISAGADQTSSGAGNPVQITGIGSSSNTYSWDPQTSLNDPTSLTPISTTLVTRIYTLFATNSLGCTKADAMQVTVPGTVGIEVLEKDWASVLPLYPNPAYNEVNLSAQFAQTGDLSIQLFDLNGRQIQSLFEGKVTAGAFNHKVQRGNIASGVYMVVWQMNNETISQKVSFE